jgi:hypothetical protein
LIPLTVKDEISKYLGCDPKPYRISFFNESHETACEYWDLPTQKDNDKSIHLRYTEILQQITRLYQQNQNDPQIGSFIEEANKLLIDVPVTKKYGAQWISLNDLLKLDTTKGLRKEWWELRSRFKESNVCIFQGYKSIESQATRIADFIVVMPFQDQYEFLRMNQTRGNNYPIETEQIILALKEIEHEFGVVVVYALSDYVEFVIEQPVEAKKSATIYRRLHHICPSADDLRGSIRLGRIALWWD